MSIKRFALGVTIGFAAGYLLRPALRPERISPEKALKLVKKSGIGLTYHYRLLDPYDARYD